MYDINNYYDAYGDDDAYTLLYDVDVNTFWG